VEVIENPGLGARAEWLYRTLSPFQPFVVIPDLPTLPSPGPVGVSAGATIGAGAAVAAGRRR